MRHHLRRSAHGRVRRRDDARRRRRCPEHPWRGRRHSPFQPRQQGRRATAISTRRAGRLGGAASRFRSPPRAQEVDQPGQRNISTPPTEWVAGTIFRHQSCLSVVRDRFQWPYPPWATVTKLEKRGGVIGEILGGIITPPPSQSIAADREDPAVRRRRRMMSRRLSPGPAPSSPSNSGVARTASRAPSDRRQSVGHRDRGWPLEPPKGDEKVCNDVHIDLEERCEPYQVADRFEPRDSAGDAPRRGRQDHRKDRQPDVGKPGVAVAHWLDDDDHRRPTGPRCIRPAAEIPWLGCSRHCPPTSITQAPPARVRRTTMLSAARTRCGNTRSGCKYHARPPRFSAVLLVSISWHVPRRSEWSWGHPGARSLFAVCRLEGPNYGEAKRCESSRSSNPDARCCRFTVIGHCTPLRNLHAR